jgi:hypothetical protein
MATRAACALFVLLVPTIARRAAAQAVPVPGQPISITVAESGLLGTPHLTTLMLRVPRHTDFSAAQFADGPPSATAVLHGLRRFAKVWEDTEPRVKPTLLQLQRR